MLTREGNRRFHVDSVRPNPPSRPPSAAAGQLRSTVPSRTHHEVPHPLPRAKSRPEASQSRRHRRWPPPSIGPARPSICCAAPSRSSAAASYLPPPPPGGLPRCQEASPRPPTLVPVAAAASCPGAGAGYAITRSSTSWTTCCSGRPLDGLPAVAHRVGTTSGRAAIGHRRTGG
ncbi:hypothetical protein BRADI_1g60276v3 [Brachypodium distachyon]|uniref:Uncharacterized protein n=1 Tax=Brachypodium distachyon TaxID=15368 RepID=A0A2K2DSK9_BRADI|nr:hypothetical protein BRADI_1g60276v3 [Brachypodium distachyon]